MLTFAEEILLLLLDDEDGVFVPVPESTRDCALAGAALMDLAFANRIDTDPERLVVVDPAPVGDPVLDRILARIAGAGETMSPPDWLDAIRREESAAIREHALAGLVGRGILERHDEKLLWVFRTRRYPMIDGKAEQEVRSRIVDVLTSQDIPDPRDVALICLVDACNLLREILPKGVADQAGPRVEQLRKMDLIGREVAGAVAAIEASIVMSVAQAPF